MRVSVRGTRPARGGRAPPGTTDAAREEQLQRGLGQEILPITVCFLKLPPIAATGGEAAEFAVAVAGPGASSRLPRGGCGQHRAAIHPALRLAKQLGGFRQLIAELQTR